MVCKTQITETTEQHALVIGTWQVDNGDVVNLSRRTPTVHRRRLFIISTGAVSGGAVQGRRKWGMVRGHPPPQPTRRCRAETGHKRILVNF